MAFLRFSPMGSVLLRQRHRIVTPSSPPSLEDFLCERELARLMQLTAKIHA
jgi:hypothetical protein